MYVYMYIFIFIFIFIFIHVFVMYFVTLDSKNVENTRLRLMFSTFPSCSQMPVVFYHSVIHGLGFFIC